MGSPTSDDDATRRVPGPGGGSSGTPESPTERFADPGHQGGREHTAQFPQPGPYPPQQGYPPPGPSPQQGYPPPGPSPQQGYPPPGPYSQPGYPQQAYPQPGPYPQPGYPQQAYPPPSYPPQGPPAGPYPPGAGASGHGATPPGGGRGNRGLVIALVVGLLLFAGVAVALVVALTSDDGEQVAADPSTTSSAAPSSSASPSPTTSASPSPSETAADRTDELLAAVPADLTDCVPAEVEGDGDVAAVDCGPSATQPGPQGASFWLYDDPSTLDEVFAADAEHNGAEPMPEGEDCTTAQGWTTWSQDGSPGGEIACVIKDDTLLILWTDRGFGIEGALTAPGSTQEELAELVEWWRTSSDFQG